MTIVIIIPYSLNNCTIINSNYVLLNNYYKQIK